MRTVDDALSPRPFGQIRLTVQQQQQQSQTSLFRFSICSQVGTSIHCVFSSSSSTKAVGQTFPLPSHSYSSTRQPVQSSRSNDGPILIQSNNHLPLSPEKLAEVKTHFKSVHHYPPGGQGEDAKKVPKDLANKADVWYANYTGIPPYLEFADVPNLKLVQLTSAGANNALNSPALKSEEARKQITISSASGIHSLSIPQWILSQTISLYMHLYLQTYNTRNTQKWDRSIPQLPPPPPEDFGNSGRSLYGKTAGLLGYGHIARETARLLKAFNVNVIAANSTGSKRKDEGYIIPGTGDEEGVIPSAYYSTNDPESFKAFLGKSDILIASLPSTPQTQNLLKDEHFDALPKDAILINVGRGDLFKSETLLKALDKGHLSGAALDVTDPEPLTDGHPLYTHPLVTITPHTSSNVKGYFEVGADLLLENVKRIREGGKPINKVIPERGY